MRTSLRPFIEYRDSGLSWLGRIPAHWQVRRNGYLFAQRNETGFGDLPILEVSIKSGVSVRSFDGSARKQVMSDREKYKRAAQGDVAYNMMRLWQGAVGVAPTDGLVSPAYVVAMPYPGTMSEYFVEVLRTEICKSEINKYSRGIVSDRNRLYWDEFKQMPVCVPPTEEQAAIVHFIVHADQKIRRFIQAKRRLIELLNEQKKLLATHILARGVGAEAVTKPSGIEWLGNIPEHWEVRRLKRLAKFQSGDGITSLSINTEGQYPVYGGNGLRGYTDRFTHDGRYVIIGRQGALCGNVHYVSGQFWASEHAVVATLGPQIDWSWFGEMIRLMNLNQYSQSAAQPGLSFERIRELKTAVPPYSEQIEIVRRFRLASQEITNSILMAESQIKLIREYRTRLIADVVTGKIDVREAAARLLLSTEQAASNNYFLDLDEADVLDDDPELLPVAVKE